MLFIVDVVIVDEAYALWFSPNWGFRQMITIDESMIPDNVPLSNFPVLIQLTSADNNPVFASVRSDGYDILFTQSDGVTPLSHEIEEYNSATEDLNMWVRIPVLDDDGDTEIYMYYGNPGITTNPSATNTWDSNFLMVQHLQETSGTHFDSTSNGNNGTPQNGVIQNAIGQINGADDFDGVDDVISVPSFQLTNLTVSFWLWLNSVQGWSGIFSKGPFAGGTNWYLTLQGLAGGSDGDVCLITNNRWWDCTNSQPLDTGNWYHIVIRASGSDATSYTWTLYKDGAEIWSLSSSNNHELNTYDFCIGREMNGTTCTGSAFKGGLIDEVRISDTVRSPDWIETSYNNQNNPSSFLSFGAPETFVPVPTMTGWGMVVFVLLAGVGSIYYIRRQRIES